MEGACDLCVVCKDASAEVGWYVQGTLREDGFCGCLMGARENYRRNKAEKVPRVFQISPLVSRRDNCRGSGGLLVGAGFVNGLIKREWKRLHVNGEVVKLDCMQSLCRGQPMFEQILSIETWRFLRSWNLCSYMDNNIPLFMQELSCTTPRLSMAGSLVYYYTQPLSLVCLWNEWPIKTQSHS